MKGGAAGRAGVGVVGGSRRREWAGGEVGRVKGEGRGGGPGWGGEGRAGVGVW